MTSKKLLGIATKIHSKDEVLEKIQKNIDAGGSFLHIVSLNPEIITMANKLHEYKKVIETAQIHISDGIGVVIAGQILGIDIPTRITGVDMMDELCNVANKNSVSVVLIGGRPNVALKLAKCQKRKYPKAKFYGIQGYKDKNNPTEAEEEAIFSIVAAAKPSFIFVSFGSPYQEIWIERHKKFFSKSVCMGVGGGFDFLSGEVSRAPVFIRKIGLEWLYRLIIQPWRWRRQLRLIEFIVSVLRQRISHNQS
ncbi:MAG TPA: WecB/TagA/CpsF family glycosyltransferase [Candidatus Nitrosocosmicus sp.]|nr:WecB/TagA/CpsF family glycosyltransferase [Candidatus Nitrosocosmicus sp.]